MFAKLLKTSVGTCPECGMSLDLYRRPINVKYLLCCNCEKEYSEEDVQRVGYCPNHPNIELVIYCPIDGCTYPHNDE